MARSNHLTLLPLDTYASILGIDLWTWNQIGLGFPDNSPIGINENAIDRNCRDVFFQDFWHRNAISRNEIALAIQRAEDMLAKALSFYPAPKYIVNEPLQYPHKRMPYAFGLGAWSLVPFSFPYPRGYSASVETRFQKIQAGGTLARELIGSTTDLTLINSTTGLPAVAPAINDMFTCTIATSITNADEIAAYFLPADRVPVNVAVDESWRLRPVNISISGGVATITGHSTLLVLPALENIVNPEPLDVTDSAIYAAQISVYRLHTDTTNAGTAYWEAQQDCNDAPCDPTSASVCMGNRNWNMGQTFIGFTDTECCAQYRAPEQVKLNYLAGEPLINGHMNPVYAQYVAFLATGLLANFPCGCDRANKMIEYWRFDVSSTDQALGGRPLTPLEQESPFGYSRGALYVWERIYDNQHIMGAIIT
jgi:hypothetical protein